MTLWDALIGRSSDSSGSSASTPSIMTSSPDPSDPSLQSGATLDSDSEPTLSPSPYSSILPDPATLHPLANLNPTSLDYLTLDDTLLSDLPGARSTAIPGRGWTDDLCYGTGITYVSALSAGGAWGLAEGLSRTPPTAAPRLRLNGVLNAVTRRGPFLGNSAGVLALVYNLLNSSIGSVRGKHDALNSIGAGFASGALFKSTRGLQPMLISGGLVAGAAGTWTLLRKTFF